MSTPEISVCIATYNGARYVEKQLHSILEQLSPDDEVVVVDDASTDDTVARVEAVRDPRVRLVRSERNHGSVRAFEAALWEARGELLLLADQDDLWLPGRVRVMRRALEDHDVVATNLATIVGDSDTPVEFLRGPLGERDWTLKGRDSTHYGRNIFGTWTGTRPYFGCAMGVRRGTLDTVLPMPAWLDESHDRWIALYGNFARSIEHVEFRTVARRLHASNLTPQRPRSLAKILRSRVMLLRAVVVMRQRVRPSRRAERGAQ